MPVNLSQIKDLLLPGLRGIEGKYEMIPTQWDKIYTKHDSKLALERTAEMRFLGFAQLKNEGGQTAFDNGAGERYVYNQEHTEIGLGYAMTRKVLARYAELLRHRGLLCQRLGCDLLAQLATDAQLRVVGDLFCPRLAEHVRLPQQAIGVLFRAGAGLVELGLGLGAQAGHATLRRFDAGIHRRGVDHDVNACRAD